MAAMPWHGKPMRPVGRMEGTKNGNLNRIKSLSSIQICSPGKNTIPFTTCEMHPPSFKIFQTYLSDRANNFELLQ